MLPAPIIVDADGILVVRDDLLPGGTKRRVIGELLHGAEEFVYASPAYGYAQVALAYACRDRGFRATIFTAKRKTPHPRTVDAIYAGAHVAMVPTGYLSNVQAKAQAYCELTGAKLLPFGLDTPEIRHRLAEVARKLFISPDEVWAVAGSGTLIRSLEMAWPDASFHAVQVGHEAEIGNAERFIAPEKFEQDARVRPPFPSCLNYDAKAWRFINEHARPGALFWNVA